MVKALKMLTFIDMMFLALLILSASVGEALSGPLYVVAFLIPFAIGFEYSKRLQTEREEERGLAEEPDGLFGLGKKRLADLLPTLIPSVFIIFSLSAVTSLLLGWLGFSGSQPAVIGFAEMVVIHAIVPAILEEMLFRYIPMKLLLPYSPKNCVIVSALFFALIHTDFFQIPYAFAAGVIFMALDIAFGSIWPSVILHFLNNFLSVVWMKYCTAELAEMLFIASLALVACVSCILLVRKRRAYNEYLRCAFAKGTDTRLDKTPILLIVMSFYIAFIKLFS